MEFAIKAKPYSPGNPHKNAIPYRIHQVIVNLVRMYNIQETYVDDADPWMGILSAYAFIVCSMYHSVKGKRPGQLVFGQDMILPISKVDNWRYIRQHEQ